jgi:hypothetical protein
VSEPTVTYTVKEMLQHIEDRVELLERSAARQTTVRWAVLLAAVSGPGSVLLTWLISRH